MTQIDDVLLGKIETIQRCVKRIKESYQGHESEFFTSFDKQDAILLNLQRACESSIDLAAHIIRKKKLGFPKTTSESFSLLEKNHFLPTELCKKMQAMVGFRNIAIHEYAKLDLNIVKNIIEHHLTDFIDFTKTMIKI